jgi:putative tricarboxylic transport membrane protein
MTEEREGRAAFRVKGAEITVAALFVAAGVLVMYDSVRLGSTWGDDGPQPGYFPFYIGLIMTAAALVNLAGGFMVPRDKNPPFVLTGQLRMVLTVLVPAAIYAGAIGWIGIYVSSILFIAFFMRWLGKFAWWKVTAVSTGTAVALFLVFERWFLVPLPKGPIEAFLGLN